MDYLIRLEQGRGARPSPEVLQALAAALRLTDDERAHLFDLAGRRLPSRQGPPDGRSPAAADRIVQALSPNPAMVLNHRFDVVAWNPECAGLFIDFGRLRPGERNIPRLGFLHPHFRDFFQDRELVMREWTAYLRAVAAARPEDQELADLVMELSARSDEFVRYWELAEVKHYRASRRALLHPGVGPLTVNTEVLIPAEQEDHRIIVYFAANATSQAALDTIAHRVCRDASHSP